jgi:hypothetical protein
MSSVPGLSDVMFPLPSGFCESLHVLPTHHCYCKLEVSSVAYTPIFLFLFIDQPSNYTYLWSTV